MDQSKNNQYRGQLRLGSLATTMYVRMNNTRERAQMYRIQTSSYHAYESYIPPSVKVEPFMAEVQGYGYNDGDPDEDMEVIVIESETIEGMHVSWLEYAVGCSAIHGADDDHYDYFPANFSALVHLGHQLDALNGNERCLTVCRVIWDQLAFQRWDAGRETHEEARANFDDEIVPRP